MNEQQAKKAIDYLSRVASFNGHTDVYDWATDPMTNELMNDIRALLKDIEQTTPQELWTDYENRFEVREEDGDFWIWDYATKGILGGNVFKSELEAEGFKEEFIEYEKEKELYYNKSGR